MKPSIHLNSRQKFALRTIVTFLVTAYRAAEAERGSYHKPQYRGIAIWNAWCESVKQWAKTTEGVTAPEKVPTLVVVVDDVAFVLRKAGLAELGRLEKARIAYNQIERRRVRHTLARQQRTLFPDSEAEIEAAELGVGRYVHVVHVGSKELLEVWIGERIGSREWATEELLALPAQTQVGSGPRLLAFDRGEIPSLPKLQPTGENGSERPSASRFQDDAANLDLDVTGRTEQEDQQGTDEGA